MKVVEIQDIVVHGKKSTCVANLEFACAHSPASSTKSIRGSHGLAGEKESSDGHPGNMSCLAGSSHYQQHACHVGYNNQPSWLLGTQARRSSNLAMQVLHSMVDTMDLDPADKSAHADERRQRVPKPSPLSREASGSLGKIFTTVAAASTASPEVTRSLCRVP